MKSDLLVSLNTATTFDIQHGKCKSCSFSITPRIQNNQSGKKRVLICSKGIKDPELCLENIDRTERNYDDCDNDKWDNAMCSRTL